MNPECPFCQEYNEPWNNFYYNNIGEKIGVASRILCETKNWYAIPSLGCLVPGYILIVCKQHFLSLANLPIELFREFLEVKKDIEKIIRNKTGQRCICFEHGVTSTIISGANSVDHVHLHVVPFSHLIWSDISEKYHLTDFETLVDYDQLFALWENTKPNAYLFFQDIDCSIYYKRDVTGFTPQFFRMCISPYLNVEQWNWKQEYYIDNIIKTIKLFD